MADSDTSAEGSESADSGPVADEHGSEEPAGRSSWSRQYPPILSLLGALLIAVVVLPSSLNIPQTPPTQTLQFAPVPPEDQDEPPPPEGNFDNLGLGSSQNLSGDGVGGGTSTTLPAIPPPEISENPTNTRCVGDPPRQTEDPLSPPCVAFFDGDNFGSTYRGVTAEEIRVLIYVDGNVAELGNSQGTEPRPQQEYFDLFEAPDPDTSEHSMVTAYRNWQQYFNDRFQTYGRRAHFIMYFSDGKGTPAARRADAADNYRNVEPFAVISYEVSENEDAYLEAMAARGVLNFGAFSGRTEEFFQDFPKLIWGYEPSVQTQVASYVDYVCRKVIPHPAVLSDNAGQNGQARTIGVIHTGDPDWAGLQLIAEEVKAGVEDCGGEIAAVGTYPDCCYNRNNSVSPDYAQQQMAEFQGKDVSTILYLGGIEGYYGAAATAIGYYPEWILLDTGIIGGNHPVRLSGMTGALDGRGVVITPATYKPALPQQACYQAYRDVDQDMPDIDLRFHCDVPYRNLFQFFVAVQVAGPRLGPTSIDKGMHAIPAIRSPDPQVPACFYLPGDYTCVKDAQAKIWDAGGQAPGDTRPGCWRAIESGDRYLSDEWPDGNIDAQMTGDEPCDGHNVGSLSWNYPTPPP